MRVVQLDPRLSLHPFVFGLSDRAWRAFIEGYMFLAQNPQLDFIPARTVVSGAARELVNRGVWGQDGGVFRVIEPPDYPDSPDDVPRLPLIAEGFDSKVLELASKPESSKALVVEGKSVAKGEAQFERFWDAFDLKSGKKEARIAWKEAVKRADPELIIERAAATAEWFANHPDPPKRKYAQGWLNKDRWEDVLGPYPNANGRKVGPGGVLMQQAADMKARGE